MDDIIIIRAKDPDGSVFQRIKDILVADSTEVTDILGRAELTLTFPGLDIKPNSGIVLRDGSPVQLNYGGFSMLCHLARHPGLILSKDQLYTAAYGESRFDSNTVPNTICRIRRKIEPDPHHPTYIKTVIGMGYRFEIPKE